MWECFGLFISSLVIKKLNKNILVFFNFNYIIKKLLYIPLRSTKIRLVDHGFFLTFHNLWNSKITSLP
jgi:hypothetical protein